MSALGSATLRATLAAAALASCTAAQALHVTQLGAKLDFASYTASFSSANDGFDPSTLATYASNSMLDWVPLVASSADWTTPLDTYGPPGPDGGNGTAGATYLNAAINGDQGLVHVSRFGDFTLGAGQSISASVNYTLYSAISTAPSDRSWVELKVLGVDGGHDYTHLLTQSTESLSVTTFDGTTLQGTLMVNFTNTGSDAETLQLALNANVAAGSTVPVPEPSSLALMLAGSLGLLLAARGHTAKAVENGANPREP